MAQYHRLSLVEREELSRMLAAGPAHESAGPSRFFAHTAPTDSHRRGPDFRHGCRLSRPLVSGGRTEGLDLCGTGAPSR